MALGMHPDVRKRLTEWVYPGPLLCIVLYQWGSAGLSLLVQGITQGDDRMVSPAYHYISQLDFMPGGASLWWAFLWLITTLGILLSMSIGVKALVISLCVASLVPLAWGTLLFFAALRDPSVSFQTTTNYGTFFLIATVTGLFLLTEPDLHRDSHYDAA